MIQADDVYRAVKALWGGPLAVAVPGGVWQGRPNQAAGTPYAVAKVEEQPHEFNTGAGVIQRFGLTITVWSTAGAVDAGTIRRQLDTVIRAGLALQHGTLLHCLPAPGALDTDPAPKDARDVLVTACAFDILAQSTK
ncbi:MAG: hypothetical protein IT429_13670 [Gemmataceae bacterium]|nr:hypothetical protein [Gemmataceae bacterium]